MDCPAIVVDRDIQGIQGHPDIVDGLADPVILDGADGLANQVQEDSADCRE